VVDGYNLTIKKGDLVTVIGHSGCGKSTVLMMLAGLNPITSGDVVVDGRVVDGPGPDRAVVFQAPCLLPWMTSYGNVMLGVKQQRVGIARAIALKPKMLLLDEPFGRLDSLTRMDLQDTILDILDKEKITTMLITHDVDEAVYMADRICMMTNGPEARVGQVLNVPFERPRKRADVMADDLFYDLRASLISFLEKNEKTRPGDAAIDTAPRDPGLIYEAPSLQTTLSARGSGSELVLTGAASTFSGAPS